MQPKVTIIDGNNEIELSTVEENVKAYMVKGEPGADGVSPSASISKTGDIATITITDKNGTTEADVIDGYNPTISTSRVDRTTTITITDIDGTATTEIYDGIDLTGGVPTNGVIGWDGNELIYTCDGTETGSYYFTYENVNYYFTMPTVEDGDSLIFNTLTSTLTLDGTTITTAATGTGSELTFVDNIPNGYEITNETFPGSGGDYADLTNKPKINGVELYLNQTSASLGIVTNTYIDSTKPSYSAKYINDLTEGNKPMGSIVVDDVSCKNMFNKYDIVSGKYYDNTTGAITTTGSANNYLQETYIKVQPNTEYIASAVSGSTFIRLVEYTSDKSFIKTNTSGSSNTITITTTANTQYIRISMVGASVLDTLQLELGSEATTYTPFINIIKEQNGYVKENTTFYANDFKCKNMFDPVLYADGQSIVQSNSVVTVSDGEFTFVSSGADMYFGQIVATPGTAYTGSRGKLIDVENLSKITFTTTNINFNRIYITGYDSNLVSLGYEYYQTNSGVYTVPSNCKYVTIRFGMSNAVSGTTYKTKVQVEAGDTPTTYTIHKEFDNQEVYSLGEQIVGTYDGKTLYRQTIIATPDIASGTASASFTIPIANVDQAFIKDMTKIADTSTSGYVYGFPFLTGSASIGGYISVGTSNLTFNVRKTTNVGFYSIKLVLEYTKTTS